MAFHLFEIVGVLGRDEVPFLEVINDAIPHELKLFLSVAFRDAREQHLLDFALDCHETSWGDCILRVAKACHRQPRDPTPACDDEAVPHQGVCDAPSAVSKCAGSLRRVLWPFVPCILHGCGSRLEWGASPEA